MTYDKVEKIIKQLEGSKYRRCSKFKFIVWFKNGRQELWDIKRGTRITIEE